MSKTPQQRSIAFYEGLVAAGDEITAGLSKYMETAHSSHRAQDFFLGVIDKGKLHEAPDAAVAISTTAWPANAAGTLFPDPYGRDARECLWILKTTHGTLLARAWLDGKTDKSMLSTLFTLLPDTLRIRTASEMLHALSFYKSADGSFIHFLLQDGGADPGMRFGNACALSNLIHRPETAARAAIMTDMLSHGRAPAIHNAIECLKAHVDRRGDNTLPGKDAMRKYLRRLFELYKTATGCEHAVAVARGLHNNGPRPKSP